MVTTAARARRRDLATLRAVGLRSGQTRRTIAWQSVVTVVVGTVVALPIGIIGGRIAWQRYATELQVVAEPVTPWHLSPLSWPAPAWRAARRSPIELLRSE